MNRGPPALRLVVASVRHQCLHLALASALCTPFTAVAEVILYKISLLGASVTPHFRDDGRCTGQLDGGATGRQNGTR